MKKILHISSSVKGNDSSSVRLANVLLEKLKATYPGSSIHTHDLNLDPLPHLEESNVNSFYTPVEQHTTQDKEAAKFSNAAIQEIMDADIIVIGVPYYNFSIPSTLKAWIDHVVRVGATFKYIDGVPTGHVTNKKVYLALASGAVFSEGPMKPLDFIEPYLRTLLGFIGMKDITVFRIEGTMMPEVKEKAWPKVLEAANEFAF